MKPLKQLCTPRDSVFDAAKRDTVFNPIHLIDNKIDGKSFFEENYVTDGMRTLLLRSSVVNSAALVAPALRFGELSDSRDSNAIEVKP